TACVKALGAGRQKPRANPSGASAPAKTRNRGAGLPAFPRRSADRVGLLSARSLQGFGFRSAKGFAEIRFGSAARRSWPVGQRRRRRGCGFGGWLARSRFIAV